MVLLRCSKCEKDLPRKDFGVDPRKKNNRCSWCKVCKKNWQKVYAATRRAEPKWREANNESSRQGRFGWYGLTETDYEEILALQQGGCAGCGMKPKETRRLDIDHKHQPNDKKREPWERAAMVRGLLCHLCNRVLGIMKDNPDTLRNLARYLDYPPAIPVLIPKFQQITEYLQAYEQRKPQ